MLWDIFHHIYSPPILASYKILECEQKVDKFFAKRPLIQCLVESSPPLQFSRAHVVLYYFHGYSDLRRESPLKSGYSIPCVSYLASPNLSKFLLKKKKSLKYLWTMSSNRQYMNPTCLESVFCIGYIVWLWASIFHKQPKQVKEYSNL